MLKAASGRHPEGLCFERAQVLFMGEDSLGLKNAALGIQGRVTDAKKGGDEFNWRHNRG